MGTDITGSNHSKQTTNSIYCQGCEKKSLTDWWGESREGIQTLWRATNPYLLKIKNAFTSLHPDYGEGYTNLCRVNIYRLVREKKEKVSFSER